MTAHSLTPLSKLQLLSRPRPIFIGISLFLLTVFTCFPAVYNRFVGWDDPIYVSSNKYVAQGLTADSIAYALTTFDSFNWIPITWLSYETDAALFGLNATAFHSVNVFWHACNVCLLFYVWWKLTGAAARSAVVATLFSVHPLHVESVAWVSARKDLLSTFLFLLAILAYRRYVMQPSRWRYSFVAILMGLGLMAKPMVVTLPLLLLLLDIWPLCRTSITSQFDTQTPNSKTAFWRLLLEKAPLVLLAVGHGLITMAAQHPAMTGAASLPLPLRLGNAVCAYVWYLWKTVWPTGLSPFYQHPLESLSPVSVVVCGVFLLGLTVFVMRRKFRQPELMIGWLWFLVSLLPVIGIVQVGTQAYADRYSYLPHIGLLMAIVWPIAGVLQPLKAGRWLGATLAVAATVSCVVLTEQQILVWRDDRALWTRALQMDPYNAIAHLQLGQIDTQNRDWDAALDHYSNVLVYRPSDRDAIVMLGYLHQQKQDWHVAAEYYQWVLRLSPRHAIAAQNLASLPIKSPAVTTSSSAAAVEKKAQALRHARRGETQQALSLFQEAAKLDPGDAILQNNVATALEELNRLDEAQTWYQQALRAKPGDVEATHGLDRIRKRKEQRPWPGL